MHGKPTMTPARVVALWHTRRVTPECHVCITMYTCDTPRVSYFCMRCIKNCSYTRSYPHTEHRIVREPLTTHHMSARLGSAQLSERRV